MTIHPLGRDKPGQKMTSPPSVADHRSISAHSRSIHEQKKNIQRFSLHGAWVAMLGSFITSQNLYVNLDYWQKGSWGWNGWHVFSIFTEIPQEKLPPGPHPARPIQNLAVWQIFDKFLEYFPSFACPNIQLNTGLLLHMCRSDYSDGSDSGDKRNYPHHHLLKLKFFPFISPKP